MATPLKNRHSMYIKCSIYWIPIHRLCHHMDIQTVGGLHCWKFWEEILRTSNTILHWTSPWFGQSPRDLQRLLWSRAALGRLPTAVQFPHSHGCCEYNLIITDISHRDCLSVLHLRRVNT